MPRFEYDYDLFISYAHADNVSLDDQLPWIEALAAEIKANHAEFSPTPLRICIDREVIHCMDEWEFRIKKDLKASRVMLAVMSPSYFASEYCHKEWELYLERERARAMADRAIAPLYVIDVPEFEAESDEEFERWRLNLRSRQHVDIRPWWQDGPEVLKLSDVRARMAALEQSIAGVVKASDRVADSPTNIDGHNEYFSGRERELKAVREALALNMRNKACVLQGLGGIGKSSIAVEYAHAYGADYPGGRFLVGATGQEDFGAVLRQLAVPFGVGSTGQGGDGRDVLLERILQILGEGPRRLFVIDDVESPTLLSRSQLGTLVGFGDLLDVMLTTRLSPDHFMDCAIIAVESFSDRDGAALLDKYRSVDAEEEREVQCAIADCLGGYPLLVEAAAVYLWQNPEIPLDGFLERLQSEGPLAVDTIAQTEGIQLRKYDESSVTRVLGPTLASLADEEWAALEIAAVLPAGVQLWRWIRDLLGERYPHLAAEVAPGYPDPWLRCCRRLIGLRLLQGDAMSSCGRMHQVMQMVVRARMGEERVAACRQRVLDFVEQRALVLAVEWFQKDKRVEVDAMIPVCLEALATGNAEQAAGIAVTMDQAWVWVDKKRELFDLYEQLLNVFEGAGIEMVEADLKAAFAGHLGHWDLDRSARLAREAHDLVADLSDVPDLALARIWQMYALHGVVPDITLNQRVERLQQAREYAHAAGDAGVLREISVLNNLGMSFVLIEASKAMAFFNRAFELATESHPPGHPSLAVCLANRGWAATMLGRHDEAIALIEEALEIDQAVLHSDHKHREFHLCNLATALSNCGRHDDAIAAAREAVTVSVRRCSSTQNRASSLSRLGACEQQAERFEEAKTHFLESLDLMEQTESDRPTVSPDVLTRLGYVCDRLGQKDEAIRWYLRSREEGLLAEDLFADTTIDANKSFYNLATGTEPAPEVVIGVHPDDRDAADWLGMELACRLARFGIEVGVLDTDGEDLPEAEHRVDLARRLRRARGFVVLPTESFMSNPGCREQLREIWWRCLAVWMGEPTPGIEDQTNPMMPPFVIAIEGELTDDDLVISARDRVRQSICDMMSEEDLNNYEHLFQRKLCLFSRTADTRSNVLDAFSGSLLDLLLGTHPAPETPTPIEVWDQIRAVDYGRKPLDPARILAAMSAREVPAEKIAEWLPTLPHAIGSEWLVLLRALAKGLGRTWAYYYPGVMNPQSEAVQSIMQNNHALMAARSRGTPAGILVSLAYNFRITSEIQHAYYCYLHHFGRDPSVDLATIAAMYITLRMYDDVVRNDDDIIARLVDPLLDGRSIEDGLWEQ